MKHKCKITVIKKECYEDLQARYLANPGSGPCPMFEVGQEFILCYLYLYHSSQSSSSIRSILNTTGRVPSLQQAIIIFSSFVHPFMIDPPCRAVYTYRLMASYASAQNFPSIM